MANESIRVAFERMWQHTTSALNDKSSEALASAKEYTDNALSDIKAQTSVTYSELVSLRNNAELIPGMFYRITDYQCTTTQENTQAADHRFDIIVQALSESTLSENASADYHYEKALVETGVTLKDSVINGPEELVEGAVVMRYYEYIDFSGPSAEGLDPNYKADDVFIAYDYLENNQGITVPVLYKTDVNEAANSPEEFGGPDYDDVFYYIGVVTIDGTEYTKWRKIHSTESPWDGEGQIYMYTDVVTNPGTETGEINVRDAYFADCNLPAWELKYSLDNDTTKFAWADTENGKGVIYWMKDEWNNECPYDFKNIMFKRPISLENGYPEYDDSNGTDTWLYTFTAYDVDNNEYLDASIITGRDAIDDSTQQCYGNKIEIWRADTERGLLRGWLNDIVFINYFSINDDFYFYCYLNIFGDNCYVNTFGDKCYNNTFGSGCDFNIFGGDCTNNTFGSNCTNNIFGNQCHNNTFGNTCWHNTFGYNCQMSTFGYSCQGNTFGNQCYKNTFDNECYNNVLENRLSSIHLENDCSHLNFTTTDPESTTSARCITVKSGIRGTNTNNKRTLTVERGGAPVVFEASGTTHIILD